MAGFLSHVPGGIGVFEAVILAALPTTMGADKVAAALLMYRLVYYLAPFALSLLFLSLHEGWRALGGRVPANRFGQAMAVIEPALRALRPLGPLLLAAVVFGSGLWMTISSLLPPLTEAAETAETLLPLAFVEGSALMTSILGAMLIVLALGTIIDSVSIILIMVPLFLPIVSGFGGDAVWFGILTVIAVEVGLLTPPLGMACFVIKSSLDDRRITLGDIFLGALPFAGIMVAVLGLLIAWPDLVYINRWFGG